MEMKDQSHKYDLVGFTLESMFLKVKTPEYVAYRPDSEINEDVFWISYAT